jgi:hypothetical protein
MKVRLLLTPSKQVKAMALQAPFNGKEVLRRIQPSEIRMHFPNNVPVIFDVFEHMKGDNGVDGARGNHYG